MEIGWKLKKLYYYLENIFTERIYLIGQDRFGLIGHSNKLIGKCFGWRKTIICLEQLNYVKNFYKPLQPFRKLSFNKYYYPWFFFNKLIHTIIIYKEKGNKEVSIGYVSSFYSKSIVSKDSNIIIVIDHPKVTINFLSRYLLNEVTGDSATISTKDIIVLGYFKTNE